MNEDTTSFSYLLSGSTLVIALASFYIGRALWIARHQWAQCSADTKVLYLLVAPALTLAVDVLEFTDRLFWSRKSLGQPARARATRRNLRTLRTRPAMRADG